MKARLPRKVCKRNIFRKLAHIGPFRISINNAIYPLCALCMSPGGISMLINKLLRGGIG